jgi:hypothetical protein
MTALRRARARILPPQPSVEGLPREAVRAQPAQGLELPVPRRAGEQLGTERHAALYGPL